MTGPMTGPKANPLPISLLPLRTLSDHHPLQASKWISVPVLLDSTEMERLLNHLNGFWMFQVSGVVGKNEGYIERSAFLRAYAEYIDALKDGKKPQEAHYRNYFSCVMTVDANALYVLQASENQYLIKIAKPVVQLQALRIDYSQVDGKFRTMVHGSESILWGIQFSYPQLCLDPDTLDVMQVKEGNAFPNTKLFRTLQLWVRRNTVPTPFIVNGEVVYVPVRLGKESFRWINCHPQLIAKHLHVLQT